MESPPQNLLQAILSTGHQMAEALAVGDVDAFVALTAERGALIARLDAYGHPSELDPDWMRTSAALAEQHQQLAQAVAEQERHMGETIRSMHRFKDARSRYQTRPSTSRYLNRGLCG